MNVLLIFLCAMAVVMLVGHGLWILAASLFQILRSPDSRPRSASLRLQGRRPRCSDCGHLLPLNTDTCTSCGLLQGGVAAKALRELTVASRQVKLLNEDGSLDAATLERVLFCLQARRKKVLGEIAGPITPEPELARYPFSQLDESTATAPTIPPAVPRATEAPGRHTVVETMQSVRELPPRPARRSLAELLAGFMEEKNIMWGELIGGLLMVGCSIALVLSLRTVLQQIPYFPFLLLGTLTVALYGAGLYTLHHWKLQSTSNGLLIIATLLVPLALMVMGNLASQAGEQDEARIGLRLATEAISIALFAWLMFRAGRILVETGPELLVLAVLGAAITPLAVHWFMSAEGLAVMPPVLLGAWPTACYVLVALLLFRRVLAGGNKHSVAVSLFVFMGLALFSTACALGFLVYTAAESWRTLHQLSFLIGLTGFPLTAAGLLVHRRGDPHGEASSSELATRGVISLAVVQAGVLLMLAASFLAWPDPILILTTTLLSFVVLTVLGWKGQMALLHAAALPFLVVAYVTVYHLAIGSFAGAELTMSESMAAMFTSGHTGTALVGLVVLLWSGAEYLALEYPAGPSRYYFAGGALTALYSLVLVHSNGLNEPGTAALITALYAILAAAMSYRTRRDWLSYAWHLLVLVATAWALTWREGTVNPLWGLVYSLEAALLAFAAVVLKERAGVGAALPMQLSYQLHFKALRDVAAVAAVSSLALSVPFAIRGDQAEPGLSTIIVACTTAGLAWLWRLPVLTWAGGLLFEAGIYEILTFMSPDSIVPETGLRSLLVGASLFLALRLGIKSWARYRRRRAQKDVAPSTQGGQPDMARLYTQPFFRLSLLSSALALCMILFIPGEDPLTVTGYLGWLAVLGLFLACIAESAALFAAFQVLLTLTTMQGVRVLVDRIDLLAALPRQVFGPAQAYAQLIGLSLLSVGWLVFRRAARNRLRFERLLNPPWPAIDRILIWSLFVGQFLFGLLCLLPDLLNELNPDGFVEGTLGPRLNVGFPALPCAWMVWSILAVGLELAWLGQRRREAIFGAAMLAVTVPFLLAGEFGDSIAAASALRWFLAIGFVLYSIPAWYRNRLVTLFGPLPPSMGIRASWIRGLLVGVHVTGVLALTIQASLVILDGQWPHGPDLSSLFFRTGPRAAFLGPLALIAGGLAGHAIRERSSGYAFAAGLVTQFMVMGGYILELALHRQALNALEIAHLLQVVALTAGVWGLAWLAIRHQLRDLPPLSLSKSRLLAAQIIMGLLAKALLLVPVLFWLLPYPVQPMPAALREVGAITGWTALAACLTAAWFYASRTLESGRSLVLCLSAAMIGVLTAAWSSQWDTAGNWLALHVLIATWAVLAMLMVLAGFSVRRSISKNGDSASGLLVRWLGAGTEKMQRGADVLSFGAAVLALRGTWDDPHRPWWSAGTVAIVSMTIAFGALNTAKTAYVFASVLLVNLAGALTWAGTGDQTALGLAYTQVICLAISGSIWHGWLQLSSSDHPLNQARAWLNQFIQRLSWSALALFAGSIVLTLIFGLGGINLSEPAVLSWVALVFLMGSALWQHLYDSAHLRILCLALLLVIQIAWSIPEGFVPHTVLNRSVGLLASFAFTSCVYGLLLPRLLTPANGWARSARLMAPMFGALACLLFLLILGQEASHYDPILKKAPVAWPAALIVACACLGLITAAINFAAVPGQDPLQLTEAGRRRYVYTAELLLVLLLFHLRLSMPQLFGTLLAPYWPLFVMALAFVGVGLAELFERKGLFVLAGPLHRTGLFLPIVPLLAFWIRQPPAFVESFAAERLPGLRPMLEYLSRIQPRYDKYASLWFLLGFLYMLLALVKRSFGFAVLAAVAGNIGLWSLLAHGDLEFLAHPQMWLIPPALIALAAEHFSRDRLGPQQSTALRYLALLLIYVSSTADMFIAGLGQSVVWPIVLTLLSCAGVAAGIMLRVRAFLYLGFSFLCVVIFSMIWHAAVDRNHMWVWWISGIVLGGLILTVVAIFESRRNQVMRLVEDLKKWR